MQRVVDVGPPRERMLHIIVNPSSGNWRSERKWPEYANRLAERGFHYEVRFTAGPGDATRFAREFAERGVETVVAIGGDGTVNEIANGLLDGGKPVCEKTRLAIIAAGTGGDLVRSLGARTIDYTVRAMELSAVTSIDVGRMAFRTGTNGAEIERYFVNAADVGLGAAVAQRVNASNSKAFGGLLAYLTGVVKTVADFKGAGVTVRIDGEEKYNGRAHMVVFANGRFHAGGMRMAPAASLRDGKLDVFVLEEVSRRALLTSLLPSVYRGTHVGKDGVHYFQGARVKVETDAPLLVEMDGEQPGCAPVDVEVVPQVLKVVGASAVLR